MINSYLKAAFRSIRKNKGFTAINVIGLSAGLTIFLLILFYVTDERSYDRFNTKADRIYRVNADIKYGGAIGSYAVTPPPLAAAMAGSFPEVETSARLIVAQDMDMRFKKGQENVRETRAVYADQAIFDVFTLPVIRGNPKNALTEPHSIVMTEAAARKYFGRTDVVGQFLTLVKGNVSYKITGVMRDMPVQSHFRFDLFLSMPSLPSSRDNAWGNFSFSTYILLKPGADPQKLQSRFPAFLRRYVGAEDYDQFEKDGDYMRINLTPLTAIHLQSNRQYELGINNSLSNIYIFSAIALFVLLIACVNFMNLSTARSANRAREVGVRKVLGSSRRDLVLQFLSESILVTFMATVIALLAGRALLPLFNRVANKELSVSSHILLELLPVLMAIILVVGVLAGSYPAFFLSRFQPIHVLKGKLSAGFKGGGIRGALVIFQFSISIFLIIGTMVMYDQLHYIQHKDLGFERSQVLVVKNADVLGDAKTFKQEIKQLPEVEDASLSSFLPTGSLRAPDAVFKDPGTDQKNALYTEIWPVDEDYLPTMGMKIAKGRNFSEGLSTDSTAMILNETAARMLGYAGDPVNRKLYVEGTKRTREYHVIGVLKDFNFASLRDNITPVILTLGSGGNALSIKIHAGKWAPILAKTAAKWNALSPNEHFEYSFMDDEFNSAYRSEQQMGSLVLVFTVLALIIACLGLFSLAAYAAEQRNKEIGIRKVLGASVAVITAMLSKDFIKLVMVSVLLAAPLAWWAMQKWLQGFAYRINMHWEVFAMAGCSAILIAFITISYQSIRAALANPVETLRSE